jgi:hypothetical protein
MLLVIEKGMIKISANSYSLVFTPGKPYINLLGPDGSPLAELFIFSSVHSYQGRDDTLGHGDWEIQEGPDEISLGLHVNSSLWKQKAIRFRCRSERFEYGLEIEGEGRLAEVNYFGGYYSGQLRWGSGFFWSGQSFQRGFNPEPNSAELSHFNPSEGVTIDMMGVPLPGRGHWFFTPPPFCFAFEGKSSWISLGVEAKPGDYRFTEYNYHGRNNAFHLSLSYEGHTGVNGRYQLPSIGFDFGQDEYAVLAAHIQAVRSPAPTLPPEQRVKPLWWYEPIFCGWGAQCYAAAVNNGRAADYARQTLYENFMSTLEESNICPGIVVLDDKWQKTYGGNQVDTDKWTDLAGFIHKQHANARKVLLWLKAWDPEGLPPEECITNAAGMPVACDPTNPEFEIRLRAAVRELISAQGYDADGFKIDFTARIPSGPGMRTYGDLWGLELMRRYLWIIYTEAKQVKRDALIITHTPHPYLADVLDMVRLNDINQNADINKAMALRAKIAAIACPEAVIDTDNWPVRDKAAWRSYVLLQPELGVPSLYYTHNIDTSKEKLEDEDYQLLREVWSLHRSKL